MDSKISQILRFSIFHNRVVAESQNKELKFVPRSTTQLLSHSDPNDQNLFHSNIDVPPGLQND